MSVSSDDWSMFNELLHTDLALPGASQDKASALLDLLCTEGPSDDVDEYLQALAASDMKALLGVLGEENADGNGFVYLGTVSRVLPHSAPKIIKV